MKRRSATNSRRWENLELRRAYMRGQTCCLLVGHLDHDCLGPLDPHHLFHVGSVRWDLNGNLLAICRGAHGYIHDVDSIGGTVACMFAKLEGKRRAARDRIREDWRVALGRDAVIGWLEVRRDQGRVTEAFLGTAQLILEMF